MELDLLQAQPQESQLQRGASTWVAKGIKLQDAQVSLAKDTCKTGIHATELQ